MNLKLCLFFSSEFNVDIHLQLVNFKLVLVFLINGMLFVVAKKFEKMDFV